jgi:hypothetical protein
VLSKNVILQFIGYMYNVCTAGLLKPSNAICQVLPVATAANFYTLITNGVSVLIPFA